jgi:hypothetical protein
MTKTVEPKIIKNKKDVEEVLQRVKGNFDKYPSFITAPSTRDFLRKYLTDEETAKILNITLEQLHEYYNKIPPVSAEEKERRLKEYNKMTLQSIKDNPKDYEYDECALGITFMREIIYSNGEKEHDCMMIPHTSDDYTEAKEIVNIMKGN